MLPTPPGYWTSTKELEGSYPYDPAKAKALLADAGHPDGVEISLCINASFGMPAPALKITDIMREQMKPAGISLKVTEAASNSVCAQLLSQEKSINAMLASWSGRIDPSITYALMLGSNSYYNSSQVKYDNADDLIKELQSTFDRDTQKPIFDKLNQIWVDHLPMIPLYRFSNVVAYNAEIKGEMPNLLGRPYVRVLHY
jgi:ABC-type transport system substrate-binding protein